MENNEISPKNFSSGGNIYIDQLRKGIQEKEAILYELEQKNFDREIELMK